MYLRHDILHRYFFNSNDLYTVEDCAQVFCTSARKNLFVIGLLMLMLFFVK